MEFEQIGKYKILGEIGQGAMGVVYKAHDPILNRHVAIKTISASLGSDDELRKRFHREAQAAARLNHPNIITVFDFGEEHGKIYMAMELLEGNDLKDLMTAGTLVTLEDKLSVMEQILDGLAFAHGKEVVHRDLKPGNIHIQPNGQIKIMDFGLARLGSSEMTQAGVVMGTPNYMSPEQVLGEKVDSRSDIFAMGAVFYELLTSHKPFEAESMHGVLFQVVHKEPQAIRKWAPDLPPVLVQIVEKCLIKDKNKRFQNAGEMREAMMVARQALVAGKISEATLDMESGKVFFDAVEFVEEGEGQPAAPGSWPPARKGEKWVEGTVALDEAPLQEVLDEPAPAASRSHPTLSGRSRTQVNRQGTQRALPRPIEPPSRMPLYIGGAVVVLGLVVGGVLWQRSRGPVKGPGLTPVVQLLIETRNELAQNALDNKDYKKAIETVESTINMAKAEGAADDNDLVVKSQKILTEARTKFTAIETTATEAEDAFTANDLKLAADRLQQLLELNPQHPVAKDLSGKLNQQFNEQAAAARGTMAAARDQAERVNGSASSVARAEGRTDFGKANDAVSAAEAALKTKLYAEATQKFLEARDAFDRARRAVETKMAEEAKQNAEVAKAFKVAAEGARDNMARAKSAAESSGAATAAASQEEFKLAVARAAEADRSMAANDFVAGKRAFDDARAAFERAKTAVERAAVAEKAAAEKAAADKAAADKAAADKAAADKAVADKAAADKAAADKQQVAPPPPGPGPVVPPPALPALGRIEFSPTQMGRGGFFDVATEFKGKIEFETANTAVRAGESYSIKVYFTNEGSKSARLREVTVNTRLNASGAPQKVNPSSRSANPGERVLVTEIGGAWPDAIRSWVTTVTVTSDKEEFCEGKITFRRQ